MPRPKRVAVVTGAGSGIGRAVAVRLSRDDFAVVLCGRDAARLAETRSLLASDSLIQALDLRADRAAPRVIDSTLEAFGRVDVLVNNAGVARNRKIEDVTAPDLLEHFQVNAIAPALLLSAVWPTFRRQNQGVVVNISSMAAHDPLPGFLAYGASKAALESLTRSAHAEAAGTGIRAYNIAPGAVETRMLREAVPAHLLPSVPVLSPEEVAQAVYDCVEGRREADLWRTVFLSPAP
jgi:NAD(P)-dependent dehydrogenase (short-subunit alcohol dehydrogenase family)